MIPLMSCSARLPIYALFTALFFTHNQALIIMSLYLIGIIVALIIGFFANRFLPKFDAKPFFLELPTYHLPTVNSVITSIKPKIKDFVVKAGTLIVLASVVLWIVIKLPPNSAPQDSYLAKSAKVITPIFHPIGINHWEPVAAVIPGTLAKEVVIGSLGTIYGVENTTQTKLQNSFMQDFKLQMIKLVISFKESLQNIITFKITSLSTEKESNKFMQKLHSQFTPLSAFSYLVFVLLYIPCVSTMAAIKEEFGWKLMTFEVLFLPVLAYIIAFIVYRIGLLLV